jgi:hypothetical protein
MATEYFDIPNCPKCHAGHRYKLQVDRSIVIKMLTMSDMSERPRRVRITRLFTCPKKNEEYEATFILTDTSSSRIKNVTVVGIANEKE